MDRFFRTLYVILKRQIKLIFSDNFKLLTYIVTTLILSEIIINWGCWYRCFYHNKQALEFVFFWSLFVYAIWSIIREYNEDKKSLWILTYLALAITYNPIYSYQIQAKAIAFVVLLVTLAIILRTVISDFIQRIEEIE